MLRPLNLPYSLAYSRSTKLISTISRQRLRSKRVVSNLFWLRAWAVRNNQTFATSQADLKTFLGWKRSLLTIRSTHKASTTMATKPTDWWSNTSCFEKPSQTNHPSTSSSATTTVIIIQSIITFITLQTNQEDSYVVRGSYRVQITWPCFLTDFRVCAVVVFLWCVVGILAFRVVGGVLVAVVVVVVLVLLL